MRQRRTLALAFGLAGAALFGATPAAAFPVLPEARAFLYPSAGYGVCGPAVGGFAMSCGPSGTAVGGTEGGFTTTGPSTASYFLGSDPGVNITSNFERVYPPGGGGYVESGGTSALLIYEMELCADAACSMTGSTVYHVPVAYGIDYSYTPSPLPDALGAGYNVSLSFDYYGGTPLQQATLCDFCNNPQTLAFGNHSIVLNMQTGIVYELAMSVSFNGMGTESLTFDPTFRAPPGLTLIYSPLVTGGVPEPATWALLLAGFGGVGAMARRRRAVAA
jgi:hypothetical protein